MTALLSPIETRILLRAATSKDALIASAVLERAELIPFVCANVHAMVDELGRGAGLVMVAEELLTGADAPELKRALAAQPPWSDVPIVVLARQGADSRAIAHAMDEMANVTVIERPMRVASLVSTVRTALRARSRQYEMRGLLEGLREADERKTEFLATLAHELRNPLAPLSTALALLARKKPEPAEAGRYYDLMRRQVDHMARLVNDLMEMSRITRGKLELQSAPVLVESVIHDAVEQSRPLVEGAGHSFALSLPDRPLVVHGDAVRLTQVLANLLNNAAKYTPSGGQVAVDARAEGSGARITVTDTGVGIDASMLESVFEMFMQVSGTSKAAQGGLGIGLTLVRSLVELHGGHVTASSPGLGQGATFTVWLPLAPATAADDAGTATAAAGGQDEARPGRIDARILVVDDNRDAADSLSELLRSMGASTVVAYSGEDALQRMQAEPAARVAILDIGMPGMDGYELARRFRAQPASRGMLLIALTGWGQQADRERVAAAGFDHHLLKPVDIAQLTALL